jgi:hypothetical protein
MAQIIIGVYEFVQIKFDKNGKGYTNVHSLVDLDVNDTYLKSAKKSRVISDPADGI